MFSVYPEQGYFIDFHVFSKTAKIFRAIHIDKIRDPKDMIGMVYTLIKDDIFNQSLEHIEEERLALYTFTTEKEMFGILYNRYDQMYPNETISRSISPIGNSLPKVKFFYTYQDALVYLYKYMHGSDKILKNTILKNGIDYKCFVKYMERHKELRPEEFI